MYLETFQTVRRKVWQSLKGRIRRRTWRTPSCDMTVVSSSAPKKSGRPASGESTEAAGEFGLSPARALRRKRPDTPKASETAPTIPRSRRVKLPPYPSFTIYHLKPWLNQRR